MTIDCHKRNRVEHSFRKGAFNKNQSIRVHQNNFKFTFYIPYLFAVLVLVSGPNSTFSAHVKIHTCNKTHYVDLFYNKITV